jgi:hypothetical protein
MRLDRCWVSLFLSAPLKGLDPSAVKKFFIALSDGDSADLRLAESSAWDFVRKRRFPLPCGCHNARGITLCRVQIHGVGTHSFQKICQYSHKANWNSEGM